MREQILRGNVTDAFVETKTREVMLDTQVRLNALEILELNPDIRTEQMHDEAAWRSPTTAQC